MANNVRIASTSELGEHVKVTARRIRHYVDEGMPKVGRNQFDLDACCRWIQDYREQKFIEQLAESVGGQEKYYLAQAARSNINADRDRDKLMRERSQLIPIDEINPTISQLVTVVKNALLSIEAKLAPSIGADNSRKAGEHICGILKQFADEANRIGSSPKKPKRERSPIVEAQ